MIRHDRVKAAGLSSANEAAATGFYAKTLTGPTFPHQKWPSRSARPFGSVQMERIQAALRMAKERRAEQPDADEPAARGPDRAWEMLPAFEPDAALLAQNRVLTHGSSDPARAGLDAMAGRLLRMMRRSGWVSLGVTSPTAGCGKTTVALNLAFSLARRPDLRVLLVDLDFRRPAVAGRLGMTEARSLADAVRGERPVADAFVRVGERLAIAANATAERESGGLLLGSGVAAWAKALMAEFRPGLVLYDLPPLLLDDGVVAFSPNLDGVLLTVAAEETHVEEIARCEAELADHAGLVGVVLNKCRYL